MERLARGGQSDKNTEKTANEEQKFLFEAKGKRIFNMQLAPAIQHRRGTIRQLVPTIRESVPVS
jgi:hypothetical protein